jgi:hypothetical protein
MANDQTISAWRSPAVVSFNDFNIGTANAEVQHTHKHRTSEIGGGPMFSSPKELAFLGVTVRARMKSRSHDRRPDLACWMA